jgi:hypothetical protein
MDDVIIKIIEEPKLENTVLVEGLPGIGLVGKLAVQHMLDELKAKKFAELYSPYLPPQVLIQDDGVIKLVNMEFYYWNDKKYDLILLIGDFQGITPESQYKLSEKTIEFSEKFNLEKIFTLGGLGTGNLVKTPRVFGAATDKKIVKELKKHGVIFKGGGAIFGAAGLLIGLGMQKNYDGVCLMGETHGQIIDAKAAESVLNVLTKILGIKIDMAKLEEKAKETEEQMGKVKQMISEQERAMKTQEEKFDREPPTYIR